MFKFDYGDTVRIIEDAPEKYRPNNIGCVVGMFVIEYDDVAINYDVPLHTKMYTIEYVDETDEQVPEKYIVLIEKYKKKLT